MFSQKKLEQQLQHATNATAASMTTACSRHSRWVCLLVIICLLSLPGSMLALDGLLLLYQILECRQDPASSTH